MSDRTGHPTATFALDARCRLIADGDRLVLLTDQTAAVLRGTTTSGVIADGLALLDGSRTQQQIAEHLGVPLGQWAQVVDRVVGAGLAGAVSPSEAAGAVGLQVLVGGEPATGMQAAQLHLLGRNEPLLEALAEVWLASGAPAPTCGPLDAAAPGALWVHASLDDDELAATNTAAIERSAAWLQLPAYDGEVLAVGPIHIPGQTCCSECVRIRQAANAPYSGPNRTARLLTAPRLHRVPLVVRLQADLAALIAGTYTLNAAASAVGTVHTLDLHQLTSSAHRVLRVPRCPACSPAGERAVPYPWTRSADVTD